MLEDWLKQRDDERRRRAAGRRGHVLVWKVLAPIAIAFILIRIWQLLTGRL